MKNSVCNKNNRRMIVLCAASVIGLCHTAQGAPSTPQPTASSSKLSPNLALPSPQAYVYIPLIKSGSPTSYNPAKPISVMLQYKQQPDGALTPLTPPSIPVNSPYFYVCAVHPNGHFLYMGTNPLRVYRVSRNGQLALLKQPSVFKQPPTSKRPPLPLSPINKITFTPDGRFCYLIYAHYDQNGGIVGDDDLIACQVSKDGLLHPIPGGRVKAGNSVASLTVDHTGKFLYVSVYSSDLSGNGAYSLCYRIRPNGTLSLLVPQNNDSDAAPQQLTAAPFDPVVYLASESGMSTWQIAADGTLHLTQDQIGSINVTSFVIDGKDRLVFGIGQPGSEANFHNSQLVVWGQLADGTLSAPSSWYMADDGFLYRDDKLVPKNHVAVPQGLVFDPASHMLYMRDLNTDRVFRYLMSSDGTPRLQAPWLSLGVKTNDMLLGDCIFVGYSH